MTKITTNSYLEGMRQDPAKTKPYDKAYFKATNFRLLADEGKSAGSLETIKGTKLEFKLPATLPGATYVVSGSNVTVPDLTNLAIIGGTTLGSDCVIFSCDDNGYGQVWKFTYNESTEVITGLTASGELNPAVHLIYNRQLSMSKSNRVKVISRYEADDIQRVYWIDGLNMMRVVNTGLGFTGSINNMQEIPAENIDIVADVNFTLPIIKEIVTGNLPKGKIQYAYRLISSEGAQSRFSPHTSLIDLVEGGISGDYFDYPETEEDFFKGTSEEDKRKQHLDSEKAVRIEVSNLDPDFDYIQLAYVIYEEEGLPQIFILPEQQIPSSHTFTYVHSGNEGTQIPISAEEFRQLAAPFDIPQTIEVKDNMVFAANTKANDFDVDFDARAYRFNSSRVSRIYDSQDVLESTINGASPSYPTDETLDAINPFNDENPSTNSNWLASDQYKYKADGVTLGGEGPNISYEFFNKSTWDSSPASTIRFVGDTNTLTPEGAPFVQAPRHDQITNYSSPNIGTYNLGGSWKDYKSPYKSSIFVGYARGEVYRFAIVFLDKKGNESYAKWIGDIKFPDPSNDGSSYDISSYDSGTGEMRLYPLGIKFTVTIPESIVDEISGYKIVRVDRKDNWKTRLGTGITGAFTEVDYSQIAWSNFKTNLETLTEFLVSSLVGSTGPFGGVMSWLAGAIWEKVWERIEDALDQFNPSATNGGHEGLTEENLRNIIHSAIALLGDSGFGALFVGAIADKLLDALFHHASDLLGAYYAGIATKVGSIGGHVSSFVPGVTQYGITGKNIGYIISPAISFDRYDYREGDYIRTLKVFDTQTNLTTGSKFIKKYHTDKTTGLMMRTWSTSYYRKWYNGQNLTSSQKVKRTIVAQNKMDVGEVVRPSLHADLSGFTYVNAHITPLSRFKQPMNSGSDPIFAVNKVTGIGDRKHLVILSDTMPACSAYTNIADEQDIYHGDEEVMLVDSSGDYMVSYERYVKSQYGGNTYSERANSLYIDCGSFIPVSGRGAHISEIFGGDTYVGLFDAVNYAYYFNKMPGLDKPRRVKKGMAEIFPCEADFNFHLRTERHFARNQDAASLDEETAKSKRNRRKELRRAKKAGMDPKELQETLAIKRFLHDDFKYNDVYSQPNNIRQYVPRPLLDNFQEYTKTRIWRTKAKIDAEIIDSWRSFEFLGYIDVNGNQGPIIDLVNSNGKLLFYQTSGVGIASVNERAQVVDSNGNAVSMGNAGILSRYDYITTDTGSSNRFAIVKTPSSVYHFDRRIKRVVRIGSNGLEDITFLEGMSSFFRNNCEGTIQTVDDSITSMAIHGAYDPEFSTVYFTFINGENTFTISYNEKLSCFESFYDFKPRCYFNYGHRLFSTDPSNLGHGYSHNRGNYGNFYGTYYDSYLNLIVNPEPFTTKVFDNFVILSEVINSSGTQVNETINKLRVTNDHQDSTQQTLVAGTDIRRRERTWNANVPRDNTPAAFTSFEPRMRDKYLGVEVWFTNNANKRFILHELSTTYRPSVT